MCPLTRSASSPSDGSPRLWTGTALSAGAAEPGATGTALSAGAAEPGAVEVMRSSGPGPGSAS